MAFKIDNIKFQDELENNSNVASNDDFDALWNELEVSNSPQQDNTVIDSISNSNDIKRNDIQNNDVNNVPSVDYQLGDKFINQANDFGNYVARFQEISQNDNLVKQREIEQLKEKESEIKELQRKQWNEDNQKENESFLTAGARGGMTGIPFYNRDQRSEEMKSLGASSRKIEDAIDVVEEAQKKGNTSFLGGAMRGIANKLTDWRIWDMGMTDLSDNQSVLTAVQKADSGMPLSLSEESLLDAYMLNQAVNQEYQNDLGRGYKAGKVTAEALPFMAEMAINPLSGLGKNLTKRFGIEGAKIMSKQFAKNAGIRLVGDISGATAMATTSGIPRVLADTQDRMTGDVYEVVGGGYIRENNNSGGNAFAKALAATSIENFSEMVGEYFSPVIGVVGDGVTKGLNKIGLNKVTELAAKIKASDIAKVVDDFSEKTQWHGTIGEYLEEAAGTAMNAIIVGDSQMSDLVDKDQQIDTFLGVALMGGLISGAKVVGYRTPRYEANKKLQNSKNALLNSNIENCEELIANLDGENTYSALANVITSDNYSYDQKAIVLDYVNSLEHYRGVNIADTKRKQENEVPAEQQAIESTFDDGYTESNPEIARENKLALEQAKNNLAPEEVEEIDNTNNYIPYLYSRIQLGDDVTQALDYINKKARYEGNMQGLDDQLQNNKEKAFKEIDNFTNTKGDVVQVIDNNGQALYLTSGNLSQHPDGTLDINNSSQYIIAKNEDGELLQITPKDIREIASTQNANLLKQSIEAQMIEEQEVLLNTPLQSEKENVVENIQIGDELEVNINGTPATLEIQNIKNEEGNIVAIVNIDGVASQSIEISNSQLAQMLSNESVNSKLSQSETQINTEQNSNLPQNSVQNEVLPQAEQNNLLQTEQTKEEPINELTTLENTFPRDKKGDIDYNALTPEQIFNYTRLIDSEETAINDLNDAIAIKRNEAIKLSDKLSKVVGGERIKLRSQIRAIENEITSIESLLPKKDIVIPTQETKQEQKEQIKQEVESNNYEFESVKQKWNDATKIDGIKDELVLANGEKVKGRYVLTDAYSATPSHNPETFSKSVGFPVNENGTTVNDRDYENDKNAQLQVISHANNYDQRAIHNPVVVSNDGVVISGNNRTMSGQLAAKNGTDTAYVEYLNNNAGKYGFTPEQVSTINNPRVVFVPDADQNYSTSTFAKFNADDKKSQNRVEKAVKAGKTIEETTINKVARVLDNYDTLDKAYNNDKASAEIIKTLQNDGVIGANEVAEMLTEGGILSAQGREFVETIIIGKLLSEKAVRQIAAYPDLRQTIVKSAIAMLENNKLGEFSFQNELSDAVDLLYNARKSGVSQGMDVTDYLRQGDIFAEVQNIDLYGATVIMLANGMNKGQATFRKILSLYNKQAKESASGQLDMFSGDVESKENILNNIFKALGYEQQQSDNSEQPTNTESGTEPNSDSTIKQQSDGTGTVEQSSQRESENTKSESELASESISGSDKRGIEKNIFSQTVEKIEKIANDHKEAKKIEREGKKVDADPTDAQKEAGNYKKGHINIDGLDITIENPKGSERKGVDKDGKHWSILMNNTYGYIKRTEGNDGDHIDVFLGDNIASGKVFIVDQNIDGKFDEHKVMYGFDNIDQAKQAYLSNYTKGWKGLESINEISKEDFKKWVFEENKSKPYSEYVLAERAEQTTEKKDVKRIVSDEKMEELKRRIKSKLNNLNFGIDPELFYMGIELTIAYVERGVTKYAEYTKEMISVLGSEIKPMLHMMYNSARDHKENPYSHLMDDYNYVMSYNIVEKEIDNADINKNNNLEKVSKDIVDSTKNSEQYTIEERFNEKKGAKIWAVNLVKKVDYEDFTNYKDIAKKNNGYWSNFGKKGFIFSSIEDANNFAKELFGKKEPESLNRKRNFIDSIKNKLNEEKLVIIQLRKMAIENNLDLNDTQIQEYTEAAIIEKGKEIIQNTQGKEQFDAIVELYNNQPTISMRSSERIDKQQYSTPLPISYLADTFILQNNPQRILEPTAGNGMMVFAIDPKNVIANEIDDVRLENLREQGFQQVTNNDATLPFKELGEVDAVVANPPFGALESKEYEGYPISGLDERIIVNSLQNLSDNGKAALIIGGHTKYKSNGTLASEKAFIGYLYDKYNVVDIININGDLYRKQGTNFPIRLILIDGKRKSSTTRFAPLQKDARAEAINNFDELYKRINDKQNESILSDEKSTVSNNNAESKLNNDRRDTAKDINESGTTITTERGKSISDSKRLSNNVERTSSNESENAKNDVAGTDLSNNAIGRDGNINVQSDKRTIERNSTDRESSNRNNDTEGLFGESNSVVSKPTLKIDILNEKTAYPKRSKSSEIGSVVPTNTAQVLENVLDQFEDIDQYLVDKLSYESKEELFKALSAEQIDSVALAINQMEQGHGFIIGDMTGVGKGRQAAALVRYGVKKGLKPLFITEKAALFSDLYRDMRDIGSGEMVPFIFNNKSGDIDPTITDEQGNIVYKPLSQKEKKDIYQGSVIPEGYDFAMLTYSQLNTSDKKPSDKKQFFEKIAEGNIVIMDESHNAGGEGNTGKFLQSVLQNTSGVTYLSGTFAKRADNMPIYSIKTAMNDANMTQSELIEAIKSGGVPLQEIMSRSLVECGQMIRRERDFTGVNIDWLQMESNKERHVKSFNTLIDLFNELIAFQRDHINPLIESINEEIAASQSYANNTKGTTDLGVSNTPFASKTFNLVRQMLFSLKAEYTAERAIEHIKSGLKPVIAVSNTMEGFIKDEMTEEENITNYDFSLTLSKGLDGLFRYTETDDKGIKIKKYIDIDNLDSVGIEKYYQLKDKIKKLSSGLTISPIDVIKNKIEKAGYTIGELTGREFELVFNEDGTAKKVRRRNTDKKKLARDFNSGDLDMLILNQSSSTGISLHASEKFADKRQRIMIFAQNQLDVNTEVQMRGRTDRTGQIHRSKYEYIVSPIPAEGRMTMMFKSKLKSLDANTTSSQKSKLNDIEIVDFLNKYGDQICIEYLKDNPEINAKMLDPFSLSNFSEEDQAKITTVDGAASKTSGRAALLSVEEQEQFYKDISERYTTLINYLNDTNSNDLEIETLPLNAKTLEKEVLIKGKDDNGNNVFAKNSYREKVEIDVLKKPMKSDEIKIEIEHYTNGMTAAEYRSAMVEKCNNYYADIINNEKNSFEKSLTDKLVKEKDKYEKEATKKKNADNDYVAEKLKEYKDRQKAIIERKINTIKYKNHRMNEVFNMLPIGRTLYIPTTSDIGKSSAYSIGMLIGFKTKEKLNPSTTTAVFAVLDGRRRVEIPLSKREFLDAVVFQTKMFRNELSDITLENWDSKIPNRTRKNAYIVTGNILQSYSVSNEGQLVSYTDIDGNIKQGILMPDSYKEENQKVRYPISNYIENIKKGEVVTDSTGNIKIEKNQNTYTLSVPLSKQKGGKYFLDDDLRQLVLEKNFRQSGGSMIGVIPERNIDNVINLLTDKFGIVVESNLKKEGKEKRYRDNTKDAFWRESEFVQTEQKKKASDKLSSDLGENINYITREDLPDNRKRAKGFYDPKTNSISICLENHSDIADVEATIMHEAVAHKGLRELFGKNFDRFLRKVFNDVDLKTRKKILILAERNNWDIYTATEEYLGTLAEKGFKDIERSTWLKIKELFHNMLKKIGVNLSSELSDNDLRYILWKSYRNKKGGNKSFVDTALDVNMRRKLFRDSEKQNAISDNNQSDNAESVENDEDNKNEESKESEDLSGVDALEKYSAKFEYERKIKDIKFKLREGYQDSMLALKVLQEEIAKETKSEIKDIENAYMSENQLSSKGNYEIDKYNNNYYKPLTNAISDLINKGAKYDDIKHYAIAKHGLERNRYMAFKKAMLANEESISKEENKALLDEYTLLEADIINNNRENKEERERLIDELRNKYAPSYDFFLKKDYSGLTALAEITSKVDDKLKKEKFKEKAEQLVSEFESKYDTEELWKKVNKATKKTLRKSVESGLMTRSVYERVSNMFEYYIPLRDFSEDVANDVYEYMTSDKNIFNAPIANAQGRKSLSEDPFAVIGNMAESGILQGNRNEMKQKFLNMVLNHPTDLASVKRTWYVRENKGDKEEWVASYPDISSKATAEEVQQAIAEHEEYMKELEMNGDATQKAKNINIGYRASDKEKSEHMIVVKSAGKEFTVYVNGNPRAAQAVNGLTNPDSSKHKIMESIGKLNRFMAANFTTRNPSFIISNLSRDFTFSTAMIFAKEDADYFKNFEKNFAKNFISVGKLLKLHEKGQLNDNIVEQKYFREFLENGGETGYTALNSIEEYKKIMNKELAKTTTKKGKIIHNLGTVVDAISFANRWAETISRFSAYQTSREKGRSVMTSIANAKDVTVNFNKKGSGTYGAQTFRSFYLFFNAAVQSLDNIARVAKRNPIKFTGVTSGMVALGAFIPILNEILLNAIGDDDEKDAYNNLSDFTRRNNICIYTGSGFLTIPLAIELRAFYGLGEIFHQYRSGNAKYKNIGNDIVNQMLDMFPLNPAGGENYIPDTFKPAYQLIVNKDFTGSPIYKDTPFNQYDPEHKRIYKGTNKTFVEISKLLNKASGGNDYKKGSIDINPAQVEHVIEFYLGGVAQTFNQSFKTIASVAGLEDKEWRNTPVLNRFYNKTNDERAQNRKINEAYFFYADKFEEMGHLERNYKKDLDYTGEYQKLATSKEYIQYKYFDAYNKKIKELLKEKKQLPEDNKELIKVIDDNIINLKRMAVESIEQVDNK